MNLRTPCACIMVDISNDMIFTRSFFSAFFGVVLF